MFKHVLSFRFTFFVFVLLVLGMLLIDIAVSVLWMYHVSEKRQRRIQEALHLYTIFPEYFSDFLQKEYCFFVFVDNELIDNGDVCLQNPEYRLLAFRKNDYGHKVEWEKYLRVNRLVGSSRIRINSEGHSVDTEIILVEKGESVFHSLFHIQKYIVVYIFFNSFIFSIVFFFLFVKKIALPLNRISEIANLYQDSLAITFPSVDRLSELNQISFYLQSMLRRIEYDKILLKKTAEQLSDKNKQLLQNQQEMIRAEKLAATGRLTAGLAHEIGNPLGVVQGYLELLQMEGTGAGERREYCAKALQETRRMHTLITNLLQTVRNNPVASERIDMNGLLADVVDMLRPQALFRDIDLRLVLEADNALVVAEDAGMRQVLLNAFLNAADAIQATGAGQGRIVARTRQQEKSGHPWLDICISDSGCGLAPEHAAQIFDPFFTTKEAGKGTGLGLSVSLALVESMGGSMRAANGEEGGMALHIELPQTSPAAIGRLHRERGQRK